ncbi:TonB-dependent siderophore receptor [Aliarcobacter butzleri]|uniref:TonB-dependent siderophore receptor n=1 Tax=Aliarcobacter butzleri TaxID=28197 RepID=UPI00189D6F17|nr:TonB-dependent siderophore receptor [Aliarcobacter butzleri]MBF7070835.1 TonB-dependent siderophore receptor [Aliarcobacter butzleri]
MKNYIVSKQHANKKIYLTASAITATILLSTPAILSAETVLDEINVNEKKDSYSESYKVDKSSSSKITQDLVDTPQTVQVITKKVMDEQQATTLQEALRNTPGITLNLGENGNTNAKDNINMRGFDVQGSIFKDGVRDLSNAVKDMYNTEAVEVTKGAVGSDNGRGVSSGYINQVSKTAKNVDEASGTAGYSTAKNARLTADLNKSLSETSGIRLNVLKQKGDVAGRDEVEIDRTGIATSVAFGIGTATRTTINYEHTEQDDVPDGGIPTVGLNGGAKKVDTSKFYGSSDDFEESKSDTFTIKFEQDISDNTMFTNTARYAKTSQEMLLTSPFNYSTTNSTVDRRMHARWQENEILTNQLNLTTEIQTGILLHKISTGIELTKENQLTKNYVSQAAQVTSLYNPTNISWNDLSFSGQKSDGETTTVGAYLFDSINIGEKFILTGGGRFDRYDTTNDIVSNTLVASTLEDDGHLNSYKAGLVYKPLDNGSVYISRATTQLPPGGANFTLSATTTNANNPDMEPQKSVTDEIGTKWDLLDNRLSITTAIYKTVVENETMTESDGTTSQNGEKEVKGIELGIVGDITDKWSMSAGFAKMDTEYTNSTSTSEGLSLRFAPEHTATLWTTYKFTPAFNLGAGARYVGSQDVKTSTTSTTPKIDSYVVYDVMASYKYNKNITYQLNVYNLTDEEYVANMNNSGRRYTPGASRSGLFSLNYKF